MSPPTGSARSALTVTAGAAAVLASLSCGTGEAAQEAAPTVTASTTATESVEVTATETATATATETARPYGGAEGGTGGGAGSTYYRNCDAARAAGDTPVYRGDPGYGPHLDRDDDGVGCE